MDNNNKRQCINLSTYYRMYEPARDDIVYRNISYTPADETLEPPKIVRQHAYLSLVDLDKDGYDGTKRVLFQE